MVARYPGGVCKATQTLLPDGVRNIGDNCNHAVHKIYTIDLDIGGQVATTRPWVESVLRTWDTLPGKPQWTSEISYSNVGWAISPGVLENYDVAVSIIFTPKSDNSYNIRQY